MWWKKRNVCVVSSMCETQAKMFSFKLSFLRWIVSRKTSSRSWIWSNAHVWFASRCQWQFIWRINLLRLDFRLKEYLELKMYTMNKNYSYSEERFKSTIKRSQTTTVVDTKILAQRGFKPTDRFDPKKKSFLVDLSKKIWTKRVN